MAPNRALVFLHRVRKVKLAAARHFYAQRGACARGARGPRPWARSGFTAPPGRGLARARGGARRCFQGASMSADGEDFDIKDTPETREMKSRLHELREEHRALDAAIAALAAQGSADALQLARLKKRKLILKDQIQWIEDRLTPDIIA